MYTLEIDHLTKQIHGVTVLRDIQMTLHAGRIYGVVGDNGSGKTMLMRSICGLIHPTSGQIRFNGGSRGQSDPTIGVMVENVGLYGDLTGFENLKLLSKIRRSIQPPQIRDAISRVGLDPDDPRVFRKYSLGMKQRLLLAQAIMEQPDILLLDEPTNAIDREGVELVHRIIRQEADRGAIVVLASHINVDIRTLCDQVFLMKQGVLSPLEGSR